MNVGATGERSPSDDLTPKCRKRLAMPQKMTSKSPGNMPGDLEVIFLGASQVVFYMSRGESNYEREGHMGARQRFYEYCLGRVRHTAGRPLFYAKSPVVEAM